MNVPHISPRAVEAWLVLHHWSKTGSAFIKRNMYVYPWQGQPYAVHRDIIAAIAEMESIRTDDLIQMLLDLTDRQTLAVHGKN